MKVKKAVILCGGQGTRFLPVTKALPKEMLPVVDTPVLQYIVDEMAKSGIEEVCIVISPGKEAIERHFSAYPELEESLKAKGDLDRLEKIENIGRGIKFTFLVQLHARGMADALYLTKDFVGKDAFVLSTGDDLVVADEPVSKQMLSAFGPGIAAIIGGQTVPDEKIHLYGCAKLGEALPGCNRAHKCITLVEKPKVEDAPSRFAALGRYVLTGEIFDKIDMIQPDKKGELQITDALKILCDEGKVCTYDFEGNRYDMGNKTGAVKATIDFALRHPETAEEIKEYIKSLDL
ncbi:MAG: UTP--glucose-1-phosphate uridylyltransferase [Clostridia bacterium]|nr:UTP--glucose-1-phosphate uridylyltransferase [Clostridia bacterium]MBP5649063.1 UTP--glucose-1-phosphate uridylyltransferase [Clostridia bacterium]